MNNPSDPPRRARTRDDVPPTEPPLRGRATPDSRVPASLADGLKSNTQPLSTHGQIGSDDSSSYPETSSPTYHLDRNSVPLTLSKGSPSYSEINFAPPTTPGHLPDLSERDHPSSTASYSDEAQGVALPQPPSDFTPVNITPSHQDLSNIHDTNQILLISNPLQL